MTILVGDNRITIPTIERGSVQCIATSPPYFGLRLYGDAGEEIGKERALDAYVSSLVEVMRLCRDALRDDGAAWVNLGDSYAQNEQRHRQGQGSSGPRRRAAEGYSLGTARTGDRLNHGTIAGNALLVPFRVASALQADGWTLRAMLPWVKIAAMPESVQSRPCISHEYVLFLTKRPSGYFYDADAVRVAASEKTNGWTAKDAAPLADKWSNVGAGHDGKRGAPNPAGRSLRSSDFWRAGARDLAEQLQCAAGGDPVGLITNDSAPGAFVVNPKGSGIPHFAMWPTRLVAPMILASTPEAGSCEVCGAPWGRMVEREGGNWERRKTQGAPMRYGDASSKGTPVNQLRSAAFTTLGFRPSCAHDAPTTPALVFDPFAGAGTTVAVAECLGRRAVGCELYQKNADLYRERLAIVRKEVNQYMAERGENVAARSDGEPKQIDFLERTA